MARLSSPLVKNFFRDELNGFLKSRGVEIRLAQTEIDRLPARDHKFGG
jgi:hypothetical protein